MSRRGRIWTWASVSVLVLLLIFATVSIRVLKSDWFANYVREKIISTVEESTGGKVEIGSFKFEWRLLRATVENFVLHGTETQEDAPLFQAKTIGLRLKLISGWKKAVDLDYLRIDRPSANVIVFPDGSTNIPEPKLVKKSNKPALETVVDLAIHRFDVSDGSAEFAHHRIGFTARGEKFQAQLFYRALPAGYQGDVKIGAIQLSFRDGQPLSASVDLPITIGNDNVVFKNASLATTNSRVNVTASVSHMASPIVDGHVAAHIYLPEVQRATNLALDACKRDTPCFVDADIDARADDARTQITSANFKVGQSGVEASGTGDNLRFSGEFAIDEVGRLLRISASPGGVVTVSGNVENHGSEGYSLAGKVLAHGVAVGEGAARLNNIGLSSDIEAHRNQVDMHRLRVGVLGGEFDGDASMVDYSRFRLNGRLQHISLREISSHFLKARAAYDGNVDGDVESAGDLKAKGTTGIRAQARLVINPASQGIPVSGRVQASYDGSRDVMQLGQSYLVLPHSRLDLSGTLGNQMNLDFSSTDTNDLYPALAMSSQAALKEMPLRLNGGGKLALHARVAGPLESPVVSGHVEADRLSVERRLFDRLSADFSASTGGASVQNGAITHQKLNALFSGSVGLRRWSPGNDSRVTLVLDLHNGDIADALALSGQSDVPARGTLDLSARINGTIANPQGSVQLTAANGAAYDQPFDKVAARVDLADRLIRLVSMDVTAKSAHLQADGAYNHPSDKLFPGQAQLRLTGSGVQLEQIAFLERPRPGLSGSLQFSVDVHGEVTHTREQTDFSLTTVRADVQARGVRDSAQNYGDLAVRADTSGSGVSFQVDSDLAGATIKVTGQTTLAQDYPTTASASIQNLRVKSALALMGRTFPADGTIGLSGRFSGTLKDPSGEMRVSLAKATIYSEPIDSLEASLRYSSGLAEVESFRLAAPAGTLNLNASFSHPLNQFGNGRIQVHAESGDLQLAQIRNLQEQKPGLAGTVRLMADFVGDLNTGPRGRDVSLSKLNADINSKGITYNGHSLGNASLSADTKGNSVIFRADSNLAGATIHGEGDVRLDADYPVTAKLTLANARYSNLRTLVGNDLLRPDFEAFLEASASVSGPVKRPSEIKGTFDVTRLELSTGPRGQAPSTASIALKNDGPIIVEGERSRMTIQHAHLTGPSTDISVSGTAAFTGARPLDLTVKANTDLKLFQQIERDIRSSGTVIVDAVVRGKFFEPLANGTIQLKNASLNIESLTNGISNANGVIALNGRDASIRNLTGESSGGKFSLSGFAALSGSALRYSLSAKLDHVRTRYQGVSAVNSARLTLGGNSTRSLLSGTVTVERVGFNPQSDIGSMLSQLTQRAAPNVSSNLPQSLAATRLDIRVRTAPDVRFETTLAQVLEANGDLNLVGTIEEPGIVGRINITQGNLIFFGNEYTVDRGFIAFYNPIAIDPRIDISLETTVESVTVTLNVNGPMNNLKLSYQSDPPLEFQDIVGLLVSRKRPSSDPNIVATEPAPLQQSLGQMGETAIVTQAVASPLSSRLQRVFGVNQLRIDPTFASGSALPQTRLSLQQHVANSITFTYTQDLSQSNSELVRVEWAVSPRFSAVATRDENGIFGVDFFYKRQFR